MLEENLDPDVRARVISVKDQTESFEYFWGVTASEFVLSHGDNLLAALQNSSMSAAEGQHIAYLTVTTFTKV